MLDGNNANALEVRYVVGDGANEWLARIVSSGYVNAGLSFYLADRQGSIRGLTDATGALRDQINYDAFGNKSAETNPSFGDAHGYDGYQFEMTVGFYGIGRRWYNPQTAKWTTEDPISFSAGDPNLERYVGNNAANATDPSGLEPPGGVRCTDYRPKEKPINLAPLLNKEPSQGDLALAAAIKQLSLERDRAVISAAGVKNGEVDLSMMFDKRYGLQSNAASSSDPGIVNNAPKLAGGSFGSRPPSQQDINRYYGAYGDNAIPPVLLWNQQVQKSEPTALKTMWWVYDMTPMGAVDNAAQDVRFIGGAFLDPECLRDPAVRKEVQRKAYGLVILGATAGELAPRSVGVAAEVTDAEVEAAIRSVPTHYASPRYIEGYGWTDPAYWRLVRRLQAGESVEAPSLRVAAQLRRDAFPDLVRSRYRGPLSEAPDLRGTYDWHNPQRMIHPGPHQTPHIQIKLQDGTILRIEVPQ